MPELAVTLSALRMGALDMAIGNLLGSNLFNVVIIAVDDLFYRPGALLADCVTGSCGHCRLGHHHDRVWPWLDCFLSLVGACCGPSAGSAWG